MLPAVMPAPECNLEEAMCLSPNQRLSYYGIGYVSLEYFTHFRVCISTENGPDKNVLHGIDVI